MPKLLKQVWKTFFGSFFETEEEAARAELEWKVDAAITAAWTAAIAELRKEYDADLAKVEKELRDFCSPRRSVTSSLPTWRYNKPPLLQAKLIEALQEHGVLAPIKLASAKAAA